MPGRRPDTFVGSVELTTVKGVPLRVDLHRAIDDGIRDAWDVDLLEAHGPTGPAGYLKASYIPAERFDAHYPSAFHWAVLRGGSHSSLRGLLAQADTEQPDRATAIELLSRSDGWQPEFAREKTAARRARLSSDELRSEWRARRDAIAAAHEDAYRGFRDFHRDRPFVEFIRVYAGPGALERPYRGGRRLEPGEVDVTDRRGQGVGRALYEVGALWMAARGLRLHSSGVQGEEAGAAWARFDEEGVAIPAPAGRSGGRGRRQLDAGLLLERRPELACVQSRIEQIVAGAARRRAAAASPH
mgnify:CR=1 FL=1